MKDISRYIIKLLLIAVIPLYLFSCIEENNDDCGIYLEFVYDYNMEYSNTFEKNVNVVDVFVFDANGKYLFRQHSPREQLIRGKRMPLFRNAGFGSYKILTVGGLSDHFSVSDAAGSDCVVGVTTLDEVRIALIRQSGVVSHEFSPLWIGEPTTIDYQEPLIVYPIHLIKDTNQFNLTLSKQSEEENQLPLKTTYTFEIETPEGAVYGHDNAALVKETVTYKPYSLTPGTGWENMSSAKINTMRLFHQQDYTYRIIVRHADTDLVVWKYDLMKLLKSPDVEGNIIPMQEYLDRESEWDLILNYIGDESDPESFIALSIQINDWIVWLHDIDV